MGIITAEWDSLLKEEYKKEYFLNLMQKVDELYKHEIVFPPKDELFTAFRLTAPEKVKVVILGQDPYHDEGQAHGLSFSVKPGIAIPKSLNNIYKELSDEYGLYIPNHGYLKKWADQGVLLLNTVLTVKAHTPQSHRKIGWEIFTDAVINSLEKIDNPIVYMLWGAPAGKKAALIQNPEHYILCGPHPSPLSAYRGFFGCGHFKSCNEYLEKNNLSPIDWQIDSV